MIYYSEREKEENAVYNSLVVQTLTFLCVCHGH